MISLSVSWYCASARRWNIPEDGLRFCCLRGAHKDQAVSDRGQAEEKGKKSKPRKEPEENLKKAVR
jgi:hypothetical protein